MGIVLLYVGIGVTALAAFFTIPVAWAFGDRVGKKEAVWWRAVGFSILPSAVICFVACGAVGLTILPDLSHNKIDFIGFLKFSVAGVAASGTVLVPLAALVFGGGCFFGRRSFNRIRRQTGPGEGSDV